VLLIAVGLAAYQNSFGGAFFFDDHTAIRDNPHIGELWPPGAWQPRGASAVAWRPIAGFSLAVNYALGGRRVQGYHVFNLAIHVLAGLVLFGVVRRTLTGERLRERYGRQASWLAMAIALIWLVHPLQTESVTYVIQRTELLMGLFFLLTLYCVIRAHSSPHRMSWSLGAVLACALGMGSKEVMVVAPLVVLAYDRVFLSKSFSELFRVRGAVYAGLAATWIFVLYRMISEGGIRSGSAGFGHGPVGPLDYAWTQTGVIVHYLRLCFWPYPLVVDYDDWPVAKGIGDVAASAGIVLALLGVTVWAMRRRPTLGVLGVWFFLILAPTSSFLVIITEVAAERRMYLPLAGIVVLVVMSVHATLEFLFRRLSIRNTVRVGIRITTLVIVVAALTYATVHRNEDYRSELSIVLDIVAKRPNNARAHSNAGTLLFRQGRLTEAFAHFSDAVRLKPDYPDAHNNLGAILFLRGQLEEARGHLYEALRLRKDFADAHANLGAVLQRQGQTADAVVHYSEAIRLLETALKLEPNRRDTRHALDELKRAANRSAPATR